MKSIRITVSLPHDEHEKLQNLAEENNLSLSWFVRQAVNQYLDHIETTGLLTTVSNKSAKDTGENQ